VAYKLMSSIFNEVLNFYWLGVQGQQVDLVVRDYAIISRKVCTITFSP
jgi:hypothetical protein